MTRNPYLSVVATARNDNHGGNMLRRMQIFINGLIEQSRRHQVPTELILVEWNPPGDRPSLAEALSWQVEDELCTVRIVQVPPDVHNQLRYASSLPLFQMIAKNVGIRRATGEFVLATNIDLLFSDALFQFLASGTMQSGKSYRIDRYDVRANVPLESSLEEQLTFCDRNLLRINRKSGIEELEVAKPEPVILSTAIDEPEIISPSPESPKWYQRVPDSMLPTLATLRKLYKSLLPTPVRDAILKSIPKDATHWLIQKGLLTAQPIPVSPAEDAIAAEEVEAPLLPQWQYPILHTNACGDFTLMSRQDWFAIRGYPEWEIFSFHLDSVLLYVAHYAGIEETILEDPIRVYHVEHASGWTPQTERDQTLNRRLATLGIPQLTMEQFDAIARLMEQTGQPLIVNHDTWGMADNPLPEIHVTRKHSIQPTNPTAASQPKSQHTTSDKPAASAI